MSAVESTTCELRIYDIRISSCKASVTGVFVVSAFSVAIEFIFEPIRVCVLGTSAAFVECNGPALPDSGEVLVPPSLEESQFGF